MMTWEDLATYLKTKDADAALVEQCWDEAVELVSAFVGAATVPEVILDRANLETGAALFQRRGAQNGIAGFSQDSSPVFVAKDPMNAVYPLLRRYVGWLG